MVQLGVVFVGFVNKVETFRTFPSIRGVKHSHPDKQIGNIYGTTTRSIAITNTQRESRFSKRAAITKRVVTGNVQ